MTLTAEQEKIVNSKDDLIIVKGVAGSGKSLVALHRANMAIREVHNMPLAFNDSKLESKQKNKTLFITFTNALVGDLKEKFKDYFRESDLKKIDFMTVDKFLWEICNYEGVDKSNYNVGNYLKLYDYKELIENELKKNNYNFSINFIIDELDYIRSNYLNSYSDYANFTRVGKKRKLGKNQRDFIYNNILQNTYRKNLIEDNKIDYLDFYILILKKYFTPDYVQKVIGSKYNHIIIDECQDLTKLKLLFFKKIKEYLKSSIKLTFLYDDSQSIYSNSYLGTGRTFKKLGFDAINKKLSYSYRSTKQIYRAAYDILDKFPNEFQDKENSINRELVQNDEGIKPFLIKTSSQEAEVERVCKDLESLLKIYRAQDIILVIPEDIKTSKYITKYIDAFKRHNLPDIHILDRNELKRINVKNQKVDKTKFKMYNPFNIKGLEAKVVLLLDLQDIPLTCKKEEDFEIAQLYHVCISRAMDVLYMYSVGEPNKYIDSIEKSYIKEVPENQEIDIVREVEYSKQYINENKVKRFEKEKEVIKDRLNKNNLELEEIKQLKEKMEEELKKLTLENQKLKDSSNLSNNKNIASLLNEKEKEEVTKVEKIFPDFPKSILESLGQGLFYYNNENIKFACVLFSLAIEEMFREIDPKFQGCTLGNILNELEYNFQMNYISHCSILRKKGIRSIRNKVMHGSLVTQQEVDILYNYIFKDKELKFLHNQIVRERTNIKAKESKKLEKTAELITFNKSIHFKGKTYHSVILDDNEYGASVKAIKNGKYRLNGYYTKSYDRDIFIIENFKKI